MPLSDETIFLTGFPGFIAGRLLEKLAAQRASFILLVQPDFLARARAETERIAAKMNAPRERFRIVEGDITRENLGLSGEELNFARARATQLWHLAAIYDLAVKRDTAMRVNTVGTRNVNDFARTIKNLRRYHYVSTCYVAGCRTGLIYENELEHSAGFRNFYEETKYLAEIEAEKLKTELPTTIYRPSVVVGDSQTGETAKYDGIYYLINYLRMFPAALTLANIGNDRVRLNLVPVDFVVNGMAALANDERAVGKTLQLADPSPLTTRELFETIARALAGRGSLVTIPAPIVRATLSTPISEAVTGMPRVAVPYFLIEQLYDTTQAQTLLSTHNVKCPSFPDYVKNLIEFAARHPKGK
jgi:nucleoside-diphosphate-sugar epimerase